MRRTLVILAAALAALPGCGGGGSNGKPIPADQANQMIALIGQADRQSAAGTCNGALDKAKRAAAVADQMPRSVGRDVRRGIRDGIARLESLIGSECQRPTQSQTTTTETQTQTTPTTTPTTTTPTTTTPTTTTPTTTTPTTTTPTTTTDTTTTTTTGNGGTPPGAADQGAAAGQG